jgi:hypothetical protein
MIAAKEFEGELWIKASDHHQSVKKAIEHEREACALMCEEFELLHVAEAIRYRGESIGKTLDIPSKMWYNISYFG